ncbi:hypothetical protein MTO96_040400, partial [Rhipicephalus appendiculatus]
DNNGSLTDANILGHTQERRVKMQQTSISDVGSSPDRLLLTPVSRRTTTWFLQSGCPVLATPARRTPVWEYLRLPYERGPGRRLVRRTTRRQDTEPLAVTDQAGDVPDAPKGTVRSRPPRNRGHGVGELKVAEAPDGRTP